MDGRRFRRRAAVAPVAWVGRADRRRRLRPALVRRVLGGHACVVLVVLVARVHVAALVGLAPLVPVAVLIALVRAVAQQVRRLARPAPLI
eukprot:4024575-Prymnesium_polylepis.1